MKENITEYLIDSGYSSDDAIEEVMEEDDERTEDDLLLTYTIIVELEFSWPRIKGAKFNGKCAIPVAFMNDEIIEVPYFRNRIKLNGYDLSHETVDLLIHLNDEEEDLSICLHKNKTIEIPYERKGKNKKPISFQVGTVKLTLIVNNFVETDFPGKFKIMEKFVNEKTGKLYSKESFSVDEFCDYKEDQRDVYFGSVTGYSYYPFLISQDYNLVILNAIKPSEKDESETINLYIPVYANSDQVYYNDIAKYDSLDGLYRLAVRIIWTKEN